MSKLTDSSELLEALDLFRNLLAEQRPEPVGQDLDGTRSVTRAALRVADVGLESSSMGRWIPPESPAPRQSSPGLIQEVEGEFRGDRLENVLIAMCRRGGFSGAVVSDETGLPLAVFNSPVDPDRIAAFTSILGDALVKAGQFLGQHGAEYISMDINYEDKVVVRRFFFGDLEMYLMVLCAQSMDERAEVEMSIEQIVTILN
jgi:hypothetical protein